VHPVKHAPIYFTTTPGIAPRPQYVANHAVDQFITRYGSWFGFTPAAMLGGTEWGQAREVLHAAMRSPDRYLESYEPGDLNGLGQAVYVGFIDNDRAARVAVRFTVDGNGTVRTVMP
jgi:hypothetical protein